MISLNFLVVTLKRMKNRKILMYLFKLVYRRLKRHRLDPWVGKMPWRRKWQPTLVFLPEESHGQRSLVGYGPWGRRVSWT